MNRIVMPIVLAVFLAIGVFYCDAMAMQEILSFDEIVQNADVIFIGKAIDQKCRYGPNVKMIFTDVSFQVEKVIHTKTAATIGDVVDLTFAGGKVGEEIVRVSDVPTFETSEKYIIFALMDGKTYASPIIGSFQGLFHILKDEVNGLSYPVMYGGKRAIAGFDDHQILAGPPVNKIRDGVVEESQEVEHAKYYDVTPEAVMDSESKGRVKERPGVPPRPSKETPKASVSRPQKPSLEKIMNVDEFMSEIHKRISDNRKVLP